MNAVTLNINAIASFTDEQFFQLCQDNRDLRLERTVEGELIIMPPTGWISGNRNSKLTARLELWAENDDTGFTFDSSTGYKLPNGAERSPDASWVKRERIEALNLRPNQFLPLAPDLAIELRSATDSLTVLQQKMQEYMRCGVRLGWLIDPQHNRVEVYRQDRDVEILEAPSYLSGEDVLLGFELNLRGILG
ncbi:MULTISPECIES: Uma2 family endonuclease [Spirulina sp. CCY15215]|uniref:Uma2 family endonuclease n=1 Tax=Spirulina sp. CCY15215 TaxID=2767591 RepID=UPI001951A800|nr:Uma2 family endonuclease [Spirulina major]